VFLIGDHCPCQELHPTIVPADRTHVELGDDRENGGEEAGIEHDRINAAGHADLGGKLHIELLDGFRPELGDTFEILTADTLTGSFLRIVGSDVGNGLLAVPVYDDQQVVLSVITPGDLPGDANFDGNVDRTDLAILAANLGLQAGATMANGDFDNDGKVSLTDLVILKTHFGEDAVASPEPVPEPSAVVILAVGLIAFLPYRRRKSLRPPG